MNAIKISHYQRNYQLQNEILSNNVFRIKNNGEFQPELPKTSLRAIKYQARRYAA